VSIAVEGLGRSFEGRVAVEGLDFAVAPGEIFGLLGPNGAGKTTTVRMMAGLLKPTAGRAIVCGLDVADEAQASALRRHVGLLTETPGHYERLTARENLDYFVRLNELDARRAWSLARDYLDRFGLAGREDDAVGTFSKGMRQKLAIVRALLHEPEVLLLDEPTSGLDPQAARVVRDAIEALARGGRAVVLCSHNLAEVERLCARVAVVRTRQRAVASLNALVAQGHVVDVTLDGPAEPYARLAAGAVPGARADAAGATLRCALADAGDVPALVAELARAGARIAAVVPARRPLEEAYLELMRGDDAEAAP
jgi:ABC-2 type transport system ATP-binding protein